MSSMAALPLASVSNTYSKAAKSGQTIYQVLNGDLGLLNCNDPRYALISYREQS